VPQILLVRVVWNHEAIPLRISRRFFTLDFGPEPEFPFGRKGLAIARAWQQLAAPDVTGMLILDGDVAIDPVDLAVMMAAIHAEPDAIHTAPVRLWPVSTRLERWVWGHGRGGRHSQEDPDEDLDAFTFCFTYLPRELIEHCTGHGMESWMFPHVDKQVCLAAAELDLPVRLVRGAQPKHTNY
jgi:hypothetical protein